MSSEIHEEVESGTKQEKALKSKRPQRPMKKKVREEAPQSGTPDEDVKDKKVTVEEIIKEVPTTKPSRPGKPKKQEKKPSKEEEDNKEEKKESKPSTYYRSNYSAFTYIQTLPNGQIQLPHKIRTHPRLYGKDAHFCRVCHNTHGLIRK